MPYRIAGIDVHKKVLMAMLAQQSGNQSGDDLERWPVSCAGYAPGYKSKE